MSGWGGGTPAAALSAPHQSVVRLPNGDKIGGQHPAFPKGGRVGIAERILQPLRRTTMETLKLLMPTLEYGDQVMAFKQECLDIGSSMDA